MTNIAIFVSGNGTNCENIIRHFDGSSDVRVVLVLSNRADAYALVRAVSLGVRTAVMDKTAFRNEESLTELMERHNVDFIVLAGFLLMIPPFLIARYPHRIVNIHPALLPKYGGKGMYGRHIHEAVKSAGETETGITIHYVSEVCDGGEIIFQARTAVTPEDTPEDIAAKVGRLEQEHYPEVIGNVVRQLV
ncbi:MAG: phosphoribosylglycinamide formyltransferase [Prevotella sp.]|nr:phosphoribosylglycinamide formyltransferase [Prevotella sp.]